jgi:hypothetical protein
MIKPRLAPFGMLLAAWLLAATSGHAQALKRAWVSGHGTDAAGCGAPTAPCRSLQYAHDHIVSAGGEIDVLDPAGYGALTISKSISVINDGVGTAGVQAASGAAITINGGDSDVVKLRGLSIEGVGAVDGIRFTNGLALSVEDCAIDGFTDAGIQYEPQLTSNLVVSNSRITNNGVYGVFARPEPTIPTAQVGVIMTRVEAINDGEGVHIDGRSSGPDGSVMAVLFDSVLADNRMAGANAISQSGAGGVAFTVRASLMANNATALMATIGDLSIGNSLIAGNVEITAGTVNSFGDNEVRDNFDDGNGFVHVSLE